MIAVAGKRNHEGKERMHMHEHVVRGPKEPIPPHARKDMISLQFDEQDWTVLNEVLGNEDTVSAAIDIIHDAPPEIKIVIAMLLHMLEKGVD